ncbi:hypothetical protein EI983_06945 [Roseovarius faecimaris]|uniref:DNA alkylation repair protein n=1 Tax=Roseovarius faecimaris TaxID=2494550 RepID=A0A6I6IRW8_9RHOB|nr:hypothetical protein [Roseovarius faecimaris]QGX98026.1 hypothetical protein EI983_06945 [Roseovarius faecimaris]
MSQKGFSLKDQLFNAEKIAWLAGRFQPPFDAAGFEAEVMARLPELELKARIAWIADCLGRHLPAAFPEAVAVIRAALPPPLDPTLRDDDFGDFIFAPLGEFAVWAGLEDHPDLLLDLLEDLTQRFSMEWAIRPVLNRWPERAMARMQVWAEHEHYHVRRLVSEGTRPNLPWGMGVCLTPGAALPLLDELYADRARFVTRSVANHLNDISKSDPALVVSKLENWRDEGRAVADELDWITRHALRGLVKAGHPGALRLLGYDPEAEIAARLRPEPAVLPLGEVLQIGVELTGPPHLPVMVDYVLHLHRTGGAPGRKVFKLKQARLDARGRLSLIKAQRIAAGLSTYRVEPGPHRISVQVNGVMRAEAAFDITG